MSNTELIKFYMGLQTNNELMQEVPYTDIIPALDKHFNKQWTWELSNESFFKNDNDMCCVSTTVVVYTPGRIYTGRSLCKIKDYCNNHLYAILDACESFIAKNTVSNDVQTLSNQIAPQMTPEQIMDAVKAINESAQEQVVNSAAQFYNYKDQQGMPSDTVPYESITDNCTKEIHAEITGQVSQQPNDYDTPQERLKGFSQHQIDRLNKFKKDYDILNDDMFNNYVRTWDKTLSGKRDITPNNVESFLEWVNDLGKMVC